MLNDLLVPPRQLNPAISPAVEAALLQALQVHPQGRFQHAAELKAALPAPSGAAPGVSSAGSQTVILTQPPSALPAARGAPGSGTPPVPSPLTPATLGIPLPQTPRSFPWKWAGLGAGVLLGLALLAVVAGLLVKASADTRSTQTAQARGTQTAQALAASLSQTPPPRPLPEPPYLPTATFTPTPSPLPPSATPYRLDVGLYPNRDLGWHGAAVHSWGQLPDG